MSLPEGVLKRHRLLRQRWRFSSAAERTAERMSRLWVFVRERVFWTWGGREARAAVQRGSEGLVGVGVRIGTVIVWEVMRMHMKG